MTYQTDCTLPDSLLEQITEQGLEILPELIRIVINTAMQAEREQYLGAAAYERAETRRGHANGYKPKTVTTRVGSVTFDVPQVREGGFYPEALERGLRTERALMTTLAEMYVQGVSTRKVAAITEQLCGTAISSAQVSRAAALLDEELSAWRSRPLGRCPFLFLDARYEKVRQSGQVRDAAVLLAVGVNDQGKREVLGVSVSLGEHEVHWRTFLKDLQSRGLRGVELVVSDDHLGLKAARQAVFGGLPWQPCQFHLQQNAQAYVPRHALKAEVAADIRGLQCIRPIGGGSTSGPDGGQVRCYRPEAGRVDGDQYPRRPDRVRLEGQAKTPAAHGQWSGTAQPRDSPANARSGDVSERTVLSAFGDSDCDGSQRGVADRSNLHPAR